MLLLEEPSSSKYWSVYFQYLQFELRLKLIFFRGVVLSTKWQEQWFWEEIICITLRNITDLKRDITIYQLTFLQPFPEQESETSWQLDNAKSSQRQFYSMSSELRKKELKETLEKLSACSEPLTSILLKKSAFLIKTYIFYEH